MNTNKKNIFKKANLTKITIKNNTKAIKVKKIEDNSVVFLKIMKKGMEIGKNFNKINNLKVKKMKIFNKIKINNLTKKII
jgi:hypothetical protein